MVVKILMRGCSNELDWITRNRTIDDRNSEGGVQRKTV